MKVRYDKEVDIMVIRFTELPVAESDEDKPGIIIDYAEDGSVISIEIMDASKRMESPVKMEYELA